MHTPGPWTASAGYVTAGPVTICEIATPDDYPNPAPNPDANARLIAAAPDLLAALESIMLYATFTADELARLPPLAAAELERIRITARAAIAAAYHELPEST